MVATMLTDEQKRSLYRDGYIILRGVVPLELVDAARAAIDATHDGAELAASSAMTDLLNASALTPILRNTMGAFDPATRVALGLKPPWGGRGSREAYHSRRFFNNLGKQHSPPRPPRRCHHCRASDRRCACP